MLWQIILKSNPPSKLFISGPMTGYPNYNREAFFEAERKVKAQSPDIVVVNPAVLPDGLSQEDYMRVCLSMLDVCDTVLFLKGWERSVGANTEYDYALMKRKRKVFEETPTVTDEW